MGGFDVILHPDFPDSWFGLGYWSCWSAWASRGGFPAILFEKTFCWQVHGLGVFTAKFSLPALIFLSLSTIDLANTRWSFILAMLATKILVFSLVFLTDFLLKRDLSRAALFAISSTQTNDFGLGWLFFS